MVLIVFFRDERTIVNYDEGMTLQFLEKIVKADFEIADKNPIVLFKHPDGQLLGPGRLIEQGVYDQDCAFFAYTFRTLLEKYKPNESKQMLSTPSYIREQFFALSPELFEASMQSMAIYRTKLMTYFVKIGSREDTDVEKQQEIADRQRREAIQRNYDEALEKAPQMFATVQLLYINVQINNTIVTAMVDTGAQTTVMSKECANRCGIMRMVDKRMAGQARGVGTSRIIGKIHLIPVTIGSHDFDCSFSVLEGLKADMLFGLDILRNFRTRVDLFENRLVFGVLGSEDVSVPFLSEGELPEQIRLSTVADLESAHNTPAAHEEESKPSSESKPSPSGTSTLPPPSHSAPPASMSADRSETINGLMALGFPHQQVVSVLEAAGGNPDLAAAMLMGM